jgi:hypothetical protein
MDRVDHLDAPRDRHVGGAAAVSLAQLWRWIAPGFVGIALIFGFLMGLWGASRAVEPGSAAVGFGAAALALVALGWELKAYCDGSIELSLLVDTSEALLLLVGVLSLLGVAGLVVAGLSADPTVEVAGFTLFLIDVGLIFLNVKHYFDRRDASDMEGAKPPA